VKIVYVDLRYEEEEEAEKAEYVKDME